MRLFTLGQELNIGLNAKTLSNIIEDSTLTVFLPNIEKVHKLFADRLPKDRYNYLAFDWDLENVTLHVSGSSNKIFYREEVTVELDQTEKEILQKAIQQLEVA